MIHTFFLSNYTTKLYVIFTKKVENISLILSVIERRNITNKQKALTEPISGLK